MADRQKGSVLRYMDGIGNSAFNEDQDIPHIGKVRELIAQEAGPGAGGPVVLGIDDLRFSFQDYLFWPSAHIGAFSTFTASSVSYSTAVSNSNDAIGTAIDNATTSFSITCSLAAPVFRSLVIPFDFVLRSRVRFIDSSINRSYVIGLIHPGDNHTLTSPIIRGDYFRVSVSSANVYTISAVCALSALLFTEVAISLPPGFSFLDYHVYEVFARNSGTTSFLIDGIEVATISTNVAQAALRICPLQGAKASSTGNTAVIDWHYIDFIRP